VTAVENWLPVRREVKYQIMVSPDHTVVKYNGEGIRVSAVFITFTTDGWDGDWKMRRVSVVPADQRKPVLAVPRELWHQKIPAWLEDIIARAVPRA
jgi:hypothetical protein